MLLFLAAMVCISSAFALLLCGPMWCVFWDTTGMYCWYSFGTLPLHDCVKGDPPVRLVTFDVVGGIPPVYVRM